MHRLLLFSFARANLIEREQSDDIDQLRDQLKRREDELKRMHDERVQLKQKYDEDRAALITERERCTNEVQSMATKLRQWHRVADWADRMQTAFDKVPDALQRVLQRKEVDSAVVESVIEPFEIEIEALLAEAN